MSHHQPVRPTWCCAACGVDWPCPTRQRELARDHASARSRLGLVMARELEAAMTDLPEVPLSTLYLRFLGWLCVPAEAMPGGPPEARLDRPSP